MRAVLIAALALAACSQAAPPPATSTTPPLGTSLPGPPQAAAAAVNNCPASATSHWDGGGAKFDIEETATGTECANATLDIVIRNASGGEAHTGSYPASSMQSFAGPESVADMNRMLSEWITPAGAAMDSTGDLAPWAAGAAAPSNENMPFTPAAGMTRELYESMRTADLPMYCYQQTDNEGICFAVHDGALRLLGLQTYAR